MWQEAARHYKGGGLAMGGPSFRGAAKAKRDLLRSGQFELASALEAFVVGGESVREIWQGIKRCTRCTGGFLETALHSYYLCGANAEIPDQKGWLRDTDFVGNRA